MSSELQQIAGPSPDRTGLDTAKDRLVSDNEVHDLAEEARWREHKAILRRAAEELAHRRAKAKAAALGSVSDSFQRLAESLEYASAEACSNTVRALYDLNSDRAASYFNLALRESAPDRRRKIGAALVASGLVSEAIEKLAAAGHQHCYSAFTLLFLVAKAGEIQPLIRVIENHPNMELRLAVIRLLASSGERSNLPTLKRLTLITLPYPVRSAILEAIAQLDEPIETKPSAA